MKTTRARLLEALVEAGDSMTLTEVAEAIGLTPSATHRQLGLLVEEGAVSRKGSQKEARYRLAPSFHALWTHAPETGGAVAEEWTHRGPIDWRFPLVSRVPDAPAQWGICRLLDECSRRGMFTPWLLPPHVDLRSNGSNLEWANLDPGERERRMRDPANHSEVNVYAYGSCVRGDAHSRSDVDLIVVYDLPKRGLPPFPYERTVQTIVDALNLGLPRRLDVRVYAEDEFFDGLVDMYERVRKDILATAITVFSTGSSPRFIEAGRARLREEVERWTSGRRS
jgi:predicted nucleotidyltransferase/DNA-binding transcriptional ArsR family regulator